MSHETEITKWTRKALLVAQDSVYAEILGIAPKSTHAEVLRHCKQARANIKRQLSALCGDVE